MFLFCSIFDSVEMTCPNMHSFAQKWWTTGMIWRCTLVLIIPGVTSQLRPITPLESQVFEDALIRPRFCCSAPSARFERVWVYMRLIGYSFGYTCSCKFVCFNMVKN